jgi:hypothetical protein
MYFIFFPESLLKKASRIQIFTILERLVDFKLNFKIGKRGLITLKKLSLHKNSKSFQ